MATLHDQMESLVDSLGSYRFAARVKSDVRVLLTEIPTLIPQRGELLVITGGDVEENTLLSLKGTLPISYKGTSYNIPVELFFFQTYPQRAPRCYVRPTADMVVPPNHPCVTADGLVHMPYLSEWNGTTHNCSALAALMSVEFGEKPPVRTRRSPAPSTASYPSAAQPRVAHPAAESKPPPSYDSLRAVGGRPSYSGSDASNLSGGVGPARRDSAVRDSPEWCRQELTRRLQGKVQTVLMGTRAELDREFARQQTLRDRERAFAAAEERLGGLKARLQGQLDLCVDREVRLKAWIAASDAGGERRVEDSLALEGPHALQMVDVVAGGHAIEDALYFLDRGLGQGSIELDSFLREVRRLSRRQFMLRALAMRIGDKQEVASVDRAMRSGEEKTAAPPSYSALMAVPRT